MATDWFDPKSTVPEAVPENVSYDLVPDGKTTEPAGCDTGHIRGTDPCNILNPVGSGPREFGATASGW